MLRFPSPYLIPASAKRLSEGSHSFALAWRRFFVRFRWGMFSSLLAAALSAASFARLQSALNAELLGVLQGYSVVADHNVLLRNVRPLKNFPNGLQVICSNASGDGDECVMTAFDIAVASLDEV